MSKKFKAYYFAVILVAVFSIFHEILHLKDYKMDIFSFIVIFIMAIFSEILISESNVDTSVTLRGPLTLFSMLNFPIIFVYFFGVFISFISKLYSTIIKNEYEKVIDIKLIFNISQSVVIIKAVSLFIRYFKIVEKSNLIIFISIIFLSLLYALVNLFLLGTVVSLFNNKNSFKDYNIKELLIYYFYFFMIAEMLYFSYEIYGNFALVFSIFFILPMQGTILNYYKIDDLNKLLILDNLTEAYNRYYLEKYTNGKILDKKSFTLIFFDFDNFKEINDGYGHLAGDMVLKTVVKNLKKRFEKNGKVFRYGGDEFCILINGKVNDDFESINFGEILFNGKKIKYSYSAGIFNYDGKKPTTFKGIMEILDKNMYKNKNLKKK